MTDLRFIQSYDDIQHKPDRTRSIVCVFGYATDYSASELRDLNEFATAYVALDKGPDAGICHKGCVLFRKEADGSWYRKNEVYMAPSGERSPTFEKALVAMYKAHNMPVPPEMNGRVAYFTLSIEDNDLSSYELPYNKRTQFAGGRSLIVPVPVMPRIRAKYSGAFHYHSEVALLQRQVPTDQEYKQLHALGLLLTREAMNGNPAMIVPQRVADPIRSKKKNGSSARQVVSKLHHGKIVHPKIWTARKVDTDLWRVGGYDHGRLFLEPGRGLHFGELLLGMERVASTTFDNLRVDRVDLATLTEEARLQPFPSAKERFAAFRSIARDPRHAALKEAHFA